MEVELDEQPAGNEKIIEDEAMEEVEEEETPSPVTNAEVPVESKSESPELVEPNEAVLEEPAKTSKSPQLVEEEPQLSEEDSNKQILNRSWADFMHKYRGNI